MLWVVMASYGGDEVEFTLVTEKDDLQIALREARLEAMRVFGFTGDYNDKGRPTVHVVKHKNVL
jgi:hypothetical protein